MNDATNDVTSLELSKKLAPIMVGVDNWFAWVRHYNVRTGEWSGWRITTTYAPNNKGEIHNAFSLPDILRALPKEIKVNCFYYEWNHTPNSIYYKMLPKGVYYNYRAKTTPGSVLFGSMNRIEKGKPANAAGQLLCWCYDNGFKGEK